MTADSTRWFEAMRAPRGIAVLGASDDPSKISGRALAYLRTFGYPGRLYPVNPRRGVVQGLPALTSVADADGPVDLAVVCVPADDVVPALRSCADAGVALAVVFSSGFGELGESGAHRQSELDAFLAEGSPMRVLGPNSLGLVSTAGNVVATFTSAMDSMSPRPGNLAIVSQSGAFGAFILSSADALGLGVRHFVSTGNEADLQLPEALAAVAEDPEVDVALVYVEGLREGAAFRRAALAAQAAGTKVLAVKVGRTGAGAKAASLHTGALAGEDRVYDQVFAETGVVRLDSLEAMLDAAQVLATRRVAAGDRLTIVTISGGGGIMMVDAAVRAGLTVQPWSPSWTDRLRSLIPPFGSAANPVDVTAELIYRPELLEAVLAQCAEHPDTDLVAVLLGNVAGREDELVALLDKAHRASTKPLAVAWVGGSGKAVAKLRAVGIPAYSEPARAVTALAVLRQGGHGEPLPAAVIDPDRRAEALHLLDGAAGVLDEVVTKRLLSRYGVSVPGEQTVDDPSAAAAAAQDLGFPVAVKLLSSVITHKERIGGVRLGLESPGDVERAAVEVLRAAVAAGDPAARMVVQQQIPAGFELFVGVRIDPAFGPMVLVGAGGTSVEAADDSAMASVPVDEERAAVMIRGLRHGRMLDDWRGRGPLDVAAAARVVSAVSTLSMELADRMTQLDVNPVIVGTAGAWAVDGLVLLR